MRVTLSTIGKFHTFDLARQLHQRGYLKAIFTGYPQFKLKKEGLPSHLIHTFPWLQTVCMANRQTSLNKLRVRREIEWWSRQTLDAYTALNLPESDVFVGLSGSAFHTGKKAKRDGSIYICDRGSSHIRYQHNILSDEYHRHGFKFEGIDPRVIRKEEAEYAAADAISVPSSFAKRSFIEMGVPSAKIHLIPYGVDLSLFSPVSRPDPERFDVLFVGSASLRKGLPYLLQGFAGLRHTQKHLTLVGIIQPEVVKMIQAFVPSASITCAGHYPQFKLKEIMSRSHVLVLPSVEDGMALVQAQAMACGCPVIGTTNTGAEDLYQDGIEGFVVPIRDPLAITDRMQRLADNPLLREQMSRKALECVSLSGGWDSYGATMIKLYEDLIQENRNRRRQPPAPSLGEAASRSVFV